MTGHIEGNSMIQIPSYSKWASKTVKYRTCIRIELAESERGKGYQKIYVDTHVQREISIANRQAMRSGNFRTFAG